MNTLTIYPSTKRLAKKFILPVIALVGFYIFGIVPDEDIGLNNGGGFFAFISVVVIGGVIGLIVTYFYQLKLAKTKPIIQVNGEKVYFSRHNLAIDLTGEYVFTSVNTNIDAPPQEAVDGGDFDFLLDRKESYIYVWKEKKQIKKIKITWMNLDEKLIAALLNDLIAKKPEDRESLILMFHKAITQKVKQSVKERIVLEEVADQPDAGILDGETTESKQTLMKAENKKWRKWALVTFIVFSTIYMLKLDMNPFGPVLLAIALSFSSAILATLFSLIPFKNYDYGEKYLRTFWLTCMAQCLLFSILSVSGLLS
ncbi:hypothetical protein AAOE16_03905 [Ekhidna sp. MALMAid0563]|uniref:hypothetical protein n=1 Tax=Ekhidna sp. MALMAid0563 TaxID=3143937 RepID=UPI0032DED0CB